jgi:hypothetical protein
VTGLIPEIKEKMRLLEKKQSSRDELEMEKAKVTRNPASCIDLCTVWHCCNTL